MSNTFRNFVNISFLYVQRSAVFNEHERHKNQLGHMLDQYNLFVQVYRSFNVSDDDLAKETLTDC